MADFFNHSFKLKLLASLFLIALLLFFTDVVLDYSYSGDSITEPEVGHTYSLHSLDTLFLSSVSEFGLADSLLSKTATDTNERGESEIHYNIMLPADLPIPILLHRIYKAFRGDSITIQSFELEPHRKSYIEIFSNAKHILKATFSVNDAVKRETGKIAFIIRDAELLSDEEFDALMKLPEYVTVLLKPSENTMEKISVIKEFEKDYLIYLNDDISDIDFRLKEGYSGNRLTHSVENITNKFSRHSTFIVDHASGFYNSPVFSHIENEFEKRGKRLLPLNLFSILIGDSGEEPEDEFHTLWRSMRKDDVKIVVLSYENFMNLLGEVKQLRRWGVKIFRAPYLIQNYY